MKNAIPLLLLILMFGCTSLYSQSHLTLEEAIRLGKTNNLDLKIKALEINHSKTMVNTKGQSEKTSFYFHRDQNNRTESGVVLNTIGASQTFKSGGYHKAQKSFLESQVVLTQTEKEWLDKELEKQISILFNELIYLGIRKNKLRQIDSLYEKYTVSAVKRLNQGEGNLLEKLLAENKKKEYQLLLDQLQVEIFQSYNKLNGLLHDSLPKQIEIPDSMNIQIPLPVIRTIFESQLVLNQMIQVRHQELEFEKQKWKPEFTAEYFMGNNVVNENKLYPGIQLGIALPLWKKASTAFIQGKSDEEQLAVLHAQSNAARLSIQYKDLIMQAEKYRQTMEYHLQEGRALSAQIQKSADLLFKQGSIDFFQYVFALEESTKLILAELSGIKSYNETIILLNYLN